MKRILVVDDDSAMRFVLRRFLEREGYSIDEAKDGMEAIALARKTRYALVITDLIMPEKTGFEVIQELLEIHPGSNIIAFSGGGVLGSSTCLDIARRDGAVMTFSKPFDMSEFVSAVKELI